MSELTMSEAQTAASGNGAAAEVYQYLDQLTSRDRFRKARSLCRLLQYLVTKALEQHVDEIKESVIAIDVFKRSPDFDSRLDNIVRVQAHRLRKLLETYYAAEGAADQFYIDIPPGSYVPRIHARKNAEASGSKERHLLADELPAVIIAPPAQQPVPGHADATNSVRKLRFASAFVGVFASGALLSAAVLMWTGRISKPALQTAVNAESLRQLPLSALWGSIVQPGVNCAVSFTNPAFLWMRTPRGRLYMTYQGPLSAPVGARVDVSPDNPYIDPEMIKRGPFFFSDSWTGTGEVFGVYKLTKLFSEAGHPLKVIRSRALNYRDMRDANVIFLGSPWANELQDKFNAGQTPLYCVGIERIINRDPMPGEPLSFDPVYDPKTKQLSSSFVLFSVLPGVSRGTKFISSAGIHTIDTFAGIDYFTSVAGVNELIQRFDPVHRRNLPEYFQAVIRTDVIQGDPVNPSLVLVRELVRPVSDASLPGSK